MLGEMRADLKYLVDERKRSSQRLEKFEASQALVNKELTTKIGNLENFRARIGVLTTALGIAVPTGLTVAAHKLGLLQ